MNPETFSFAKPVLRPGIGAETIIANGVRRVGATEAEHLCGLGVPGIWLPYRRLDGVPIRDDGHEFGRLRLDAEENGRKYHSRAGTRSHLYLPARLSELMTAPCCGTLHLCEGEFKALSACEAGICAAGVSGIGNAAPGGKLVDELQSLVTHGPFDRIVFIGDSDVGVIADFSRAMAKLANALPDDVQLSVIAPGLNAPAKGLDDIRAKLAGGFDAYWSELKSAAISVTAGTAWEDIALRLLKRESPAAIAAIVCGAEHAEAA